MTSLVYASETHIKSISHFSIGFCVFQIIILNARECHLRNKHVICICIMIGLKKKKRNIPIAVAVADVERLQIQMSNHIANSSG